VEVGLPGLVQLLLVDRLVGIDVLVHERQQALTQLLAAVRELEVHQVISSGWAAEGS
jgi:hypothetical protein